MPDVMEIAVKQPKMFRVNDRDYALIFPVPVVAALEEKIGRRMKSPADWLQIRTKEVEAILEAGFTHYHADEAKQIAAEICLTLDPEEIEKVIDGLCVAACPKAMERILAEMEKARERIKKGLPQLPNV